MTPLEPRDYIITTYTDGSKHKDDSTGYGVIIFLDKEHYITENYTFSNHHTVFQCEAHALYRASKILTDILSIPDSVEYRAIIYTDSQALIKSLQKSHTSNKTILMVHNALNSLSASNLISVEWIPGHCGQDGNETADKLANIRTPSYSQSLTEEKDKLPLPQSFFKRKIAEHINRKLNKRWQDCNISKITKQLISPILNYNLNGQHLFKLNTDILRPLTRLITGHNNLNHFQNKLDGTTSSTCSFCNEHFHETALHLKCTCIRFDLLDLRRLQRPSVDALSPQ
ncbi:hypothetical protein ACHWQZ_G007378 [Mnemiopsis leidyi]